MLNTDIISQAVDKHYTNFADSVKDELKDKLFNHEKIASYTKEYDAIQNMKQKFSDINGTHKE